MNVLPKKLRVSKLPSPAVQSWIPFLERALLTRRLKGQNVGKDNLTRLAALLALFGHPEQQHPTAMDLFKGLSALLMHPDRIRTWDQTLQLIAPDTVVLSRLALSLKIANLIEPLEQARYNPPVVVGVMLRLQDPREYVNAYKTLPPPYTIRGAFYPKTVELLAQTFRGLLSPLANVEHRDSLLADVEVIS